MADLILYDNIDITPLRDYFLTEGRFRCFRRRERFCSLGMPANEMGLVLSGGFSFSHPDYKGDTQIMTLAFSGELIGAYITPGSSHISVFDVTALCDSEVAVVTLDDLISYMDNCHPGIRLHLTEAIAQGFQHRMVAYRCESPEKRYRQLLERMPEINGQMSMTAIASYLGITRETFARLRNKIRKSGQNV